MINDDRTNNLAPHQAASWDFCKHKLEKSELLSGKIKGILQAAA
jgi:hypothetical protein